MPASNLCIYLPVQINFQSSLRVEDVFNGIAILHTIMLSGNKLPKLPLSQVHVGTGNCLTIATLSSSELFSPSLFDMPQVSPFCSRTVSEWILAAAGGKQKSP